MATRARVNPEPPAGDPPVETTQISCTCPVCKSVVTFENGALVGGDPSHEMESLRTRADRATALEAELARANTKLAELEDSAAGEDDPQPDPPEEPNYFL